MRAKDVEFDVTYVNLREKPDWFLEISPHGKVPVLKVGDDILFESSAIAEFLDEMVPPRLHPEDPIARAKNRAWTDFTPTFAGALSKIHYAKTREDMEAAVADAPTVLTKVEAALAGRGNNGPFFNGPDMSLVDAAYAPFLQRYLLIDEGLKNDVLKDFPLIRAWAETLMADERVTGAVPDNFEDEFIGNLHRRDLYAREFFDNTIAAE
ncbi:MAG: glutathione S-transferase family protein [Rhodospirillaceae bacterium]|nr:glutathione S-transferase family protein [Rhodospirillaceae bacterium]MBT5357705.1 glutathione S-transferase family protein [Rhodospirillaceae bacterium]MBT5768863.1 glutathione S-transferase family protein [Rhodospirillaceae bacterium]MBT6308915.1 glutathione S-transferase family protein [Rhodospirillaceae bacterium]MBT7365656.1 glutathione S-transferase family protein [Rhodospirillaceae bacterium]